jgi:hypothetical protein
MAVKLVRAVGDIYVNEESFFQLTISVGLCPLQEGEFMFTSTWNSQI